VEGSNGLAPIYLRNGDKSISFNIYLFIKTCGNLKFGPRSISQFLKGIL